MQIGQQQLSKLKHKGKNEWEKERGTQDTAPQSCETTANDPISKQKKLPNLIIPFFLNMHATALREEKQQANMGLVKRHRCQHEKAPNG